MPTEQEIRAQIEAEFKAKADAEKLAALEAQTKDFSAKQEAADKELKELRQMKVDAEKKAVADAIALKESETKAFVTALKADKLCTPGMESLVLAIIGDKAEFSVKIADKEYKTKEEALKEALQLFAAAKEVNFTESSSSGDKDSKDSDEAIEKEVTKFMAENKGVKYGAALKQVIANKKGK